MTKTVKTTAKGSPTESKPAQPSKKDQFLALLGRDIGASIAEIVAATGWQPHSTRAMLTGLRKQGRTIEKAKVDGAARFTLHDELGA